MRLLIGLFIACLSFSTACIVRQPGGPLSTPRSIYRVFKERPKKPSGHPPTTHGLVVAHHTHETDCGHTARVMGGETQYLVDGRWWRWDGAGWISVVE